MPQTPANFSIITLAFVRGTGGFSGSPRDTRPSCAGRPRATPACSYVSRDPRSPCRTRDPCRRHRACSGSQFEPGDRASVLADVEPPVENCSGSCGNGGAIWGSSCIGGRLSEGPLDEVSGVSGAGPVLSTPRSRKCSYLRDPMPNRRARAWRRSPPRSHCARSGMHWARTRAVACPAARQRRYGARQKRKAEG